MAQVREKFISERECLLVLSTKLNLGSGFDYKEGWTNIDMHDWHPVDLVCDVTKLDVIPDFHAEHILAQDILEHISRAKTLFTLQEWNRVMKMRAKIEIRTTDVLGVFEQMISPPYDSAEGHETYLHCLFGTQGYSGDFHFAGFTEKTMRALLEKAGFLVAQMMRQDGWLLNVVAVKEEHVPPDPLLRIEDSAEFIRRAYRKILKREADEGGFRHWHKQLSDGVDRETMIAQLTWAREQNPNA